MASRSNQNTTKKQKKLSLCLSLMRTSTPKSPAASAAAGKRRRLGGAGSRGRKKQKRLDAIRDVVPPHLAAASASASASGGVDDASLRRSTRVRRAPTLLDTSPVPSPRRKKPRRGRAGEPPAAALGSRKKGRRLVDPDPASPETAAAETAGNEVWGSRLRARVKGKARLERKGKGSTREEEEKKVLDVIDVKEVNADERTGSADSPPPELGRKEITLCIDLNVEAPEASEEFATAVEEDVIPRSSSEGEGGEEKDLQEEAKNGASHPPVAAADPVSDEKNEDGSENSGEKGHPFQHDDEPIAEETVNCVQQESENGGLGEQVEARQGEPMDDAMNVVAEAVPEVLKETSCRSPVLNKKVGSSDFHEGRRCGLCGGGTDGRPPKVLVHDSTESENEAYEGALASEEPNYDVWDGFGDDPGWLGRLLGPIHDRFGIARIWVHQNCAVWSPEVYFAGLGCLKNVRAALCRGRLLKCSRCGRPGATIGCRVDRCPKTYHLPCSRADSCIFDHRKFLIACNDHRHLFQPQGDKYLELLRRMKAKKMKTDMRKLSHDAWRKDIEAEEKWLEHCGEDEEFLKREGKRLHRDLLRIAPVYIGGSSENEKLYNGWESVAGLNDVIQCMKEVVILPLLYPELFSCLGLTPPRGVLLHGYPGTGKTLVVRALIGACSRGNKRIAYFARKGADCLGKYVGDAERQLRLLFQVAERCQPSIIFFDEIDGLAPCRSRQQDQTHNSVVSTLLSLLDGLKSRGSVIVIGATNRPDAVDPALRRPGRFDREIYFPLPTFEDRSAILSLHTKSWPNPLSGGLLSFIASQTVGYAGADLQAICTQAAMNALKRNCALQELLSSAEKGFEHGQLPSLPSILVEERDWLAALAAAPPPCSRREAGMAASDLVSSPLDSHLVPCLLKPLLYLLISFYLDERIWLPSSLLKASASLKDLIFSTLEKDKVPVASWSSHIHSLVQQRDVENRMGAILSHNGLLAAQSGHHSSFTFGHDDGKYEKFDSFRSKPNHSLMQGGLVHKSSGFRALVAGAPKSGQRHLAGCLLHGFMGHTEIHKVNLATMAQEGNGDILSGLTQILVKCLNLGRCVIYMPRIELWAIDKSHKHEMNREIDLETSKLPSSPTTNARKSSEVWNSFMEQMSSSASVSTTILATCELQFKDLPIGIRQFFSMDVLDQCGIAPSEHTIPRFSVNINGYFGQHQVINSCALRLSQDLVQHFIQLLHDRAHERNHGEQKEVSDTVEATTVVENKVSESKQCTILTECPADLDKLAYDEASQRDNQSQLDMDSSQQEWLSSNLRVQEENVQKIDCQQKVPRNLCNRVVKGNEELAIAAFGYQILRYPHFSKLCWVSSKLREGPCADINGPWKGWPFNSCLLHGNSSPDKVIAGENNVLKGKEQSGCVRGLIAVGLLAYRGVYTSVAEVCAEVRKVLELLVGQIRAKILEKKDRYRYFHILSQVAYLEDTVNSWAYMFQRLQSDNRPGASNTKSGLPYMNKDRSVSYAIVNSVQVAPDSCPSEIKDNLVQRSPNKLETRNGVCSFDNHVTSTSDRSTIQRGDLLQPASSDLCPSSLSAANTLINDWETCRVVNDGETCMIITGAGTCKSDIPRPESQTKSVGHLGDLQRVETTIPSLAGTGSSSIARSSMSSAAHDKCNDLDASHPFKDVESDHDVISNQRHDSIKAPMATNASCLYRCCCACVRCVYKLVHNILSNSMRSNLHCLTIDDMHDILTSCSLSLLVAIRNCYSSQDMASFEENFGKQSQGILLEPCACREITDMQLNKTQKHIDLLPRECVCHLGSNEVSGTTDAEGCLYDQSLSFFFKDGVLMPPNLHVDAALHCSFKRLCVGSILKAIVMVSQTSS